MTRKFPLGLGLATLATFGLATAVTTQANAQTIFTQWSFTAATAAPDNNPAPTINSTGTGTAITLGMDNNYNGGNTAADDIVSTPGTANAAFSENTWRIRGTAHNGWATHAAGAAQDTQGIELDTSTVGYQGIKFSFDWYSTTQGIRDLQFQYNTNTSNAGGWITFGGTSPTSTYIATSNDFYNAPNNPTITVDLSSLTGVNNDPTFGIRLVSAYDSTGNIPNDYAGAALTGGKTTIYNNSSGNWRFDNMTFSGNAITPAPEPSGGAGLIIGAGVLSLLAVRRRKASSAS